MPKLNIQDKLIINSEGVLELNGNPYTDFNAAGQLTLGNNNWLPLCRYGPMRHQGADSQGTVSSISHDYDSGGMKFVGQGIIHIQTRIPVDRFSQYKVKVRVKKTVQAQNTITDPDPYTDRDMFYCGVASSYANHNEIHIDQASSYQYGVANSQSIYVDGSASQPSTSYNGGGTVGSSGGEYTFENTFTGFNSASEGDHTKFDPNTAYFNVVIICNYIGYEDGVTDLVETLKGETIVEQVEVQRVSSWGGGGGGSSSAWSELGGDLFYNTGSVGIGTNNPNQMLHVKGHARIEGLGDSAILLFGDAVGAPNHRYIAGDISGNILIRPSDNSYIGFMSGGSEKMRIDPDGKVGIGDDQPSVRMSVAADNSAQVGSFISTDTSGVAGSAKVVHIENNTATGAGTLTGLNVDISGASTTTKYSAIFNGGNVGIGTTSPDMRLDVREDKDTTYNTVNHGPSWTAMLRNHEAEVAGRFAGIGFQSASPAGGYATGWIGVVSKDKVGDMVFGIRDEDGSAKEYHEVMRINSDGNVGIGTTSPGARLHVAGVPVISGKLKSLLHLEDTQPQDANGDSGGGISFGGIYNAQGEQATYGAIWAGKKTAAEDGNFGGKLYLMARTHGDTALEPDLTIDSTGNVGIGTDNPLDKLMVAGNIKAWATGGNAGFLGSRQDGLTTIKLMTGGEDSFLTGGNVGIGTTDPGEKLDVDGAIKLKQNNAPQGTGAAAAGALWYHSNGGGQFRYMDDSGGVHTLGSGDVTYNYTGNLWSGTNNNIYFNTGNVGIGTDDPNATLHVRGDTPADGHNNSSDAIFSIESNETQPGETDRSRLNFGLYPYHQNDNGHWLEGNAYIQARTANLVLQPSVGNVGIGTASPLAKLQVESPNSTIYSSSNMPTISNVTGSFRNAYSGGIVEGTHTGLQLNVAGNEDGQLDTTGIDNQNVLGYVGIVAEEDMTNAGALVFHSSPGMVGGVGAASRKESMRIASTGNVGIGTDSPSANLDVRSSAANEEATLLLAQHQHFAQGIKFSALDSSTYQHTIAHNDTGLVFDNTSSSDAPRPYVFMNGNVGIGSTSPGNKLEVGNPTSWFSGNQLAFGDGTTGAALNVTTDYDGIAGNNYARLMSTSGIMFAPGVGAGASSGANEMTLSESGDLDVAGDINFTGNLYQNGALFSGGGGGGGGSSPWTTSGAYTVQSLGGNVGIGTNEPDAPLEIYASQEGEIFKALKLTNNYANTNGEGVSLELAGNSTRVIASIEGVLTNTNSASDLVLSTNPGWAQADDYDTLDERMRLTSNGYVGIGTKGTTPSYNLEVRSAGNVQSALLLAEGNGDTGGILLTTHTTSTYRQFIAHNDDGLVFSNNSSSNATKGYKFEGGGVWIDGPDHNSAGDRTLYLRSQNSGGHYMMIQGQRPVGSDNPVRPDHDLPTAGAGYIGNAAPLISNFSSAQVMNGADFSGMKENFAIRAESGIEFATDGSNYRGGIDYLGDWNITRYLFVGSDGGNSGANNVNMKTLGRLVVSGFGDETKSSITVMQSATGTTTNRKITPIIEQMQTSGNGTAGLYGCNEYTNNNSCGLILKTTDQSNHQQDRIFLDGTSGDVTVISDRLKTQSHGIGNGSSTSSFVWGNDAASNQVVGDESGNGRSAGMGVFKNADLTYTNGYFWAYDTSSNLPNYFWPDTAGNWRTTVGNTTNIGKANAGTVIGTQTSDERLKNIDEEFNYGLSEVLKLKPITFTLKSDEHETKKLGFGAQTTQEIIPESVGDSGDCIDGYDINDEDPLKNTPKSEDTILNMEYVQLIPVLTKAIQELKAENDDLKERLASLEDWRGNSV